MAAKAESPPSSSEFDAMKTFTEYTSRASELTGEGLHFIGSQTGEYLRTSSHEDLLRACLAVEALFSIAFLITAFVLGTNSYAGFTAIFTGLVFLGYIWFTCKWLSCCPPVV
jgi:hypothetical protein